MPEIAGVGIVSAFLAGIVSFLSPCVLPLVPGYVSYVAGQSLEDLIEDRSAADRMATMALGLFFVMGFSSVFIAFGASASAVGELLMAYRYEANYVAGAVIALFGI
jgi:cytochrome c-type biogenesis protein